MLYTLNIGLKPSDKTTRKTSISRAEVMAALRAAGLGVCGYRLDFSDTEPTAVVVVNLIDIKDAELHNAIYRVSAALRQDCIAVAVMDSDDVFVGSLIGPDAAEWGEFDPAYFIPFYPGRKQAA